MANLLLPNFLIIGAAKSGTSSLYYYLKQHPEIFMCPIKEPHFFSYDASSKNTCGPGDTIPRAITDFDKYCDLFSGVKHEIAIGEASPTYLYREEAPQRINEMIPNIKMIAILRHPVERAFSAYMHVVRDKREKSMSFYDALQLEEERIINNWGPLWHFKKVGLYSEQLSRYYKLYNKNQIKIILHEELIHDLSSTLKEIFLFLDVDSLFVPDYSIHYNISGKPNNDLLFLINKTFFEKPNPIRWLSRKFFSELSRWKFTSSFRKLFLDKQHLSPDIRNELINYFREDILKLEIMIDKNLSHWL